MSEADAKRSGELERFAVERALYAAWTTEFWIPADPDYRYIDYFEAAAARNVSLLRGFEELAEDIDRRGIISQTDSDQAKLVTDGGQDVGGTELEPCRHCGSETTQRAEGIPYCSMDCIGARRRELEQETIECPYPNCDWSTNYDPDNGLSRTIAYHETEEHRDEHRSQLADSDSNGGNQ